MTLADWLAREKVTVEAFAEKCSVAPATITRLLEGQSASYWLAGVIQRATNGAVTMADVCEAPPSARR